MDELVLHIGFNYYYVIRECILRNFFEIFERKYGHNELDEPRLTNPLLYKHVDAQIPIPDLFCQKLSPEENQSVNDFISAQKSSWLASYDAVQPGGAYSAPKLGRGFGPWADKNRAKSDRNELWDSGYDKDSLRWVLSESVARPEGFELHSQLERHVKQRLEMAETGQKIDWGGAEGKF